MTPLLLVLLVLVWLLGMVAIHILSPVSTTAPPWLVRLHWATLLVWPLLVLGCCLLGLCLGAAGAVYDDSSLD